MYTINTGWNGDWAFSDKLLMLNSDFRDKVKIKSVFGSIKQHAWLAARPDFRLPEISEAEFASYVKLLKRFDVEFNYTLNAPYLGSKAEFYERRPEIYSILGFLAEAGVKRLIISNPMLLDFISRSEFSKLFSIEISTIAHVDTVMQALAYKELYPQVDTICGGLLKNRDFEFLRQVTKQCSKVGVTYEVLVNEFCSTGFEAGGTHCIFRDSCYVCHSQNVTKQDATLMHNYPMGNCMASRSSNGADWLRANWIRPQDLEVYMDLGVTQFKVTGRTGSTPYLTKVLKSYMSGVWDENLLDLWKPLETIFSEKPEESHHQRFNIYTPMLDGFIDKWKSGFVCANTTCAECRHCDNTFKTLTEGIDITHKGNYNEF